MPFNSHQGQKCGGGAQAGARWRAAPRDPLEERDEEIRAILMRRRDRLAGLREVLTDAALSSFAIVLAAERLPVLETIELHRELTRTGLDVGALVVNKRSPAGASSSNAGARSRRSTWAPSAPPCPACRCRRCR